MTPRLRWTLMALCVPVMTGCAVPGALTSLVSLRGANANTCAGPVPVAVSASSGAGGTVAMTWPSGCNDYPVSYRAQPR